MKIVVVGGTGLIGSKVVEKLKQKGHEAIAAAPNTGVNTITGEGLADALAGAQVVVDVANSPSFEDQVAMEFFQTAGKNLTAAEVAAGIKHHVALSVVGTDRLQDSGYFRAKLVQSSAPPNSSSSSAASHNQLSTVTQCACRTRRSSQWPQRMSRPRSPKRLSQDR
jgi:uncharacterized protein YbjT (DUF2867 family)